MYCSVIGAGKHRITMKPGLDLPIAIMESGRALGPTPHRFRALELCS